MSEPTKRQPLREKGTQSHGAPRASRAAESGVPSGHWLRRFPTALRSRQGKPPDENDGSASGSNRQRRGARHGLGGLTYRDGVLGRRQARDDAVFRFHQAAD